MLPPLLLAMPACTAAPGAGGVVPGEEVLFRDGFDGDALDRSRWNVVVSGFWVNNEQQAYIDSTAVLRIVHGDSAAGAEGGALLIQAHPRPGIVTA